jgi:energy-converting hydrogenase Eha subunit H
MPDIKKDVKVVGTAEPKSSRLKELALVCVLAVVGIVLTGVIIWLGWDIYEGLP